MECVFCPKVTRLSIPNHKLLDRHRRCGDCSLVTWGEIFNASFRGLCFAQPNEAVFYLYFQHYPAGVTSVPIFLFQLTNSPIYQSNKDYFPNITFWSFSRRSYPERLS
ncbi:hypothetical protein J4Q44_G00176820 [Coregonus suidteri]|uniref:Uncharacterized protein n=1 Tax=Coregonus suidteri TaxID=861788 RepID=A0AAN8QV63_9TELE